MESLKKKKLVYLVVSPTSCQVNAHLISGKVIKTYFSVEHKEDA